MKKLFGKIILAVLTVVMAFAAFGCGGNPDTDDGGHTHTYVNGKCSDTTCGQYELFNAVSSDLMGNFTLVIESELDTKRTSPDGNTVYDESWGTRKTKEVHTIKVADGKFFEEYVIYDYDDNSIVKEQGTKTYTGAQAQTLISSVVSQIRGYAFYEKFYAGENLFRAVDGGYILNQSFGFGYDGYYYTETTVEVRNNTSVEVLKDDLTIAVADGKISSMTFVSKENCSDAQKSWYIETLSATYTFSNYGTTVIA